MSLQCVILAGGQGTRMRPLTERVPKALIPVLGRPFVDWQLELLAREGIQRVVLSIGYRGEMLREHVGNGARYGLEITWVDEGSQRLGTAGALRFALDERALESDFYVLYGDSFLPTDFQLVEAAWRQSKADALMVVLENVNRWDTSNAILEANMVTLYDKTADSEMRKRMRWIDYGLSVMSRKVVSERLTAGAAADLADVMHNLSIEGRLAGFAVATRFYEAGSKAGLRDLEDYLRRRSGRHGRATTKQRSES